MGDWSLVSGNLSDFYYAFKNRYEVDSGIAIETKRSVFADAEKASNGSTQHSAVDGFRISAMAPHSMSSWGLIQLLRRALGTLRNKQEESNNDAPATDDVSSVNPCRSFDRSNGKFSKC